MQRDQMIAAAAAGVHVAMFAWNLAFWGLEGQPQDRYWPLDPRCAHLTIFLIALQVANPDLLFAGCACACGQGDTATSRARSG